MIDINKLNECLTLLNERLKIDEARPPNCGLRRFSPDIYRSGRAHN